MEDSPENMINNTTLSEPRNEANAEDEAHKRARIR
jgi:hypothetical protein